MNNNPMFFISFTTRYQCKANKPITHKVHRKRGGRRDGEKKHVSKTEHKTQMNFGEYACDADRMIEDPGRLVSDGDMATKNIENALVQMSGEGDGELIEIPDGLKLVKHADLLDGNFDPYIGMEFESEESAMVYYDAYARRVGFIIRVGNCHRSGRDGSVISRRFLCNKEGFRVNNKKNKCLEVRKPRAVTREGCKAMIMVRKEKSGKWVVTKLETEHSHPLGIPTGKGRQGTIQARPQDEKDKKIRELTTELHRANQKLAECREQLQMVMKDIEIHTNHITRSVHDIVENIKEIESEDQDYAYAYR